MCGRLVISEPDLSVFVEPFHVQQVDGAAHWQPRFNLAPTQLAPLVTNEPARRLSLARFGLIPSWAEDPRVANRLINARSEAAPRSKVWKPALLARRGVVPATGYFEWRPSAHGKRPVFIHDPSGQALVLAALWDQWRDSSGELIRSFALLTRGAEGFLRDLHARMPCVLEASSVHPWLASSRISAAQLRTMARCVNAAWLGLSPGLGVARASRVPERLRASLCFIPKPVSLAGAHPGKRSWRKVQPSRCSAKRRRGEHFARQSA